ncbi:MAG: hypothetical protein ABC378_13115 [Staphylococcus pseudoxylosus]|uniref:hypothetical protein n=1 Tax=Staphylococcus pseudoxylosus TaxID=2282419 RepID=UPI0031F6C298
MVYKYESKLKNRLLDLEFDTWEETAQFEREYREMREVYRKAKAWDALKELLMKEYPEVAHLADVSNGDGERGEMSKHEEVLEHMDKLDGTNEFSNSLSDLEDNNND